MQTFRNPYPDDDESPDDESTNDFTKDELTDDKSTDDESTYRENPPDPSIILESLRDIGYTLEMAIADIIDNSIAAAADNIHINFDFNEKE